MLLTAEDTVPRSAFWISPDGERLVALVHGALADALAKGLDRLSASRRAAEAVHRECPGLSDSAALAAVWRFRELGGSAH